MTETETSLTAANDLAICRALEAARVEFIDENGRTRWRAVAEAAQETWERQLCRLTKQPVR